MLFGPAYKGISLGAAVAQQLYLNHRKDVEFAYNRKEAKVMLFSSRKVESLGYYSTYFL